jgi:hypothetical protein
MDVCRPAIVWINNYPQPFETEKLSAFMNIS